MLSIATQPNNTTQYMRQSKHAVARAVLTCNSGAVFAGGSFDWRSPSGAVSSESAPAAIVDGSKRANQKMCRTCSVSSLIRSRSNSTKHSLHILRWRPHGRRLTEITDNERNNRIGLHLSGFYSCTWYVAYNEWHARHDTVVMRW